MFSDPTKSIFQIATKAIIVNEDGKILIIKKTIEENTDDASQNLYDIPGGRLEYGEKLEQALQREIKEEVGLEVVINKLLSANSFIRPDQLQLTIITYLCFCKEKDCRLSNEHSDFFWIKFNDLLNSEIYPDWIKEIVRLV